MLSNRNAPQRQRERDPRRGTFAGDGVAADDRQMGTEPRRPGGLQLWMFASNVRAQRIHERHGFTVQERTNGSGNEERAPDLHYAWRPAHRD
jgi:hypothetical protein